MCELVPKIKENVDKDNKFRPVRPKFARYDTFRVYCKAGEPKDMNLCFNEKEGVEISKVSEQTVGSLDWHDGIEISFYSLQMYKEWVKK